MSRENWWLDFVEKDIDEATHSEMKMLLRHSPQDQELVKSISETKELVKEYSEPLPEIREKDLDLLHDKIMASLEETVMRPTPRVRLRAHHHRLLKSMATGLAVLMLMLSAGQLVSNKGLNTQTDVSEKMASAAQEKPEDLSVLMTYQTEHDFFVDVASQSLDHLTKEQFESFMKVTKTR
jgi:hypothetical protein